MKSADLNIRIGVIEKLQTVLTIPIRDMAFWPDDDLPGVLLSSQTATDDSPKTNFQTQSTLLIQVYGKKNLLVNRAEVDAIADEIIQSLIPIDTSDYIDVDGFQVTLTRLESLNDDILPDSDGLVCRKLIRIRFDLNHL